MIGFYIGSIGFFKETKEELKEFILRMYKRDFPDNFSNTDYIWYKRKYFDTPWTKEDAIDEFMKLEYEGFRNSSWWTDIKAILVWWSKYGKNKEVRNLFNMED